MYSPKKTTNQFVRNFYNDYVKMLEDGYEYERWFSNKVREHHLYQTRTVLRSCIGNVENIKRIMEIGCGPGTFTKILSEFCQSITVVDISEEMLKIAAKRKYGVADVQFICGDFMNLKFEKKVYDTIVLIRCFEYFNEKPLAIEKINNMLINKGKFILVTKNPYYLGKLFRRKNNREKALHSGNVSIKGLKEICGSHFEGEISFYPVVFNFLFIPIDSLKVKLNNYFFNKYFLSDRIPHLLSPFLESYVLVGEKS